MRDKILNTSFVVSVIVNLVFLVLVGNSDIFREGQNKADVIAIHKFTQLHPPIKKKPPPPKHHKPPPPPPHPIKYVKPPPPLIQTVTPHPVIIKTAPQVIHTAVTGTTALPIQATTAQPPEQAAPPTPPPAVVTPPPPPPVVVKPPPPPPPPPPKPKPPAIPDRAEAIPINDFADNITSGIEVDTSTLSSTTVVIRFDVGADGKPFNFKILTSSGNSDLDQAAIGACRDVRFKPAIQDGEPIVSRQSHTFQIS